MEKTLEQRVASLEKEIIQLRKELAEKYDEIQNDIDNTLTNNNEGYQYCTEENNDIWQ